MRATATSLSLVDLVDRLGGEAVAFDLEALQVLGQPDLEAEDFQQQVRLLQQLLALPGGLRPDEDFQQVVQITLDAFAQHEAVVAGELTRALHGHKIKSYVFVITTSSSCHLWSAMRTYCFDVHLFICIFIFDLLRG